MLVPIHPGSYSLVRLSRKGLQQCCTDSAHVQYELKYTHVTDLVSGFCYGWFKLLFASGFCLWPLEGLEAI